MNNPNYWLLMEFTREKVKSYYRIDFFSYGTALQKNERVEKCIACFFTVTLVEILSGYPVLRFITLADYLI